MSFKQWSGRRLAIYAALFTAIASPGRPALAADAANPRPVLRATQGRVVKLYGAGGLRGLEAYQSGLLVSAKGHVLTINSSVLDSDRIAVVTSDGARREARLLSADPISGVALLKVDPGGVALPCWDLADSPVPSIGSPVWVLANLFGIATGDEQVTVLHGIIAARAPLRGASLASRFSESADALLLDMVTSNPGSAGGAVTDLRGRLLGMLGRETRSPLTGTWVSHAIPAVQLNRVFNNLLAGSSDEAEQAAPPPVDDLLPAWGFALAPRVGKRTPPYVDYVPLGGLADAAGLRADDLVVLWDGRVAATRDEVLRLAGAHRQAEVVLTVQRGETLIDFKINRLGEAPTPRVSLPKPAEE